MPKARAKPARFQRRRNKNTLAVTKAIAAARISRLKMEMPKIAGPKFTRFASGSVLTSAVLATDKASATATPIALPYANESHFISHPQRHYAPKRERMARN